MGRARVLNFKENIRSANCACCSQCDVNPPQNECHSTPFAAPIPDTREGSHDYDGSTGDDNAGQASRFGDIGIDRDPDLFGVYYDTSAIDGQHEQQKSNGQNPEDVSNDTEASELIVKLVQDDGCNASTLGDEKPLGGEVTKTNGERRRSVVRIRHAHFEFEV